jgi:hypothetical protein
MHENIDVYEKLSSKVNVNVYIIYIYTHSNIPI